MRIILAICAGALLAGCASVPDAVRNAPAESPGVAEVRGDPSAHEGERVRWGGTIAEVVNQADRTLVAVVARSLDSRARPRDDDRSDGRFLASIDSFLDPAVYTSGREITVVGTVTRTRTRAIGDYAYDYPVVDVSGHVLWQARQRRDMARYGPYYDPWWDYPYPWHFRHYPYRYPYYYW